MNQTTFADRVSVWSEDHGTSMILPWEIDSVVSFRGTLSTSPDFASGEEVLQDILVGMLDKGTKLHTKLEISTLLEDCGASIRFSSSSLSIRFDAKCLKSDLDLVLGLINEQLLYPALDEREFELLKNRFVANIQRMESDTGARSSDFLSRQIYSPNHPRYVWPSKDLLEKVHKASVLDVRSYWEAQVGLNDFAIVAVGDVADRQPADILSRISAGLGAKTIGARSYDSAQLRGPGESDHIEIADRSNLDVKMGHGIEILKRSPDYLPLYLGVFVLGGNFSSRLMSTIRDRDGLTYGIRSGLSGVHRQYSGAWTTSVTLSKDKLDQGIAATTAEISAFFNEKTPNHLLEPCKTTLIGSYQIQLSTTSGLAATLLSNFEEGHPVERIDTYPTEIQLISAIDVDAAISKHLNIDRLNIVSAGTR